MICAKCQTNNPGATKFCIECANPFEIQCPGCGVTNPAKAKFCMECAHNLRALADIPAENLLDHRIESPAIESTDDKDASQFPTGERKHVTVLFSDLSGYTAMSEKMDPEVLH